jgi:hypothetical protein
MTTIPQKSYQDHVVDLSFRTAAQRQRSGWIVFEMVQDGGQIEPYELHVRSVVYARARYVMGLREHDYNC